MLSTFVQALMSAEADAVCGADYGSRSVEGVKRRNGYRVREWDTRAGPVERAIPKFAGGLLFPGLAVGGAEAGRAGAHLGGGQLLPARGVDAADGEAGRAAGG